jgi:succinate-semialdehyde dehydrogenase/glutarate-semialdehyde dehydrogenase
MAGNAVVLKHAPNVTACALALRDIAASAEVPSGVLDVVLVAPEDVPEVVPGLIADRRVDAVTFTGSDRAGSIVASLAGLAVKKSVLELGGSDPFIVLADADIPAVAAAASAARFLNAGQSCVSPKRFIVDGSVAAEFARLLAAAAEKIVVGDPNERETELGPLARADLLATLERQVEATVAEGAEIALGGARVPRRGFFFPPTVLTSVANDMTAAQEELFGPVACVLAADGVDDAVALANDTRYGLGASIWTADVERAEHLAHRVESGSVFVNGMVVSDPRLPIGGTKRSGYGRELGTAGIREFANLRTFWFGPTGGAT